MILQWVMKHCLSEGVIAAAKVVGQHCPISVFCLVGSQDDKSRQQPPSILLLGMVMFSCFETIFWQVELFNCLRFEFAHGLFRWALPVALIWGAGGQWKLECSAYHVDGLPQPSCWSARTPLRKKRCPGS